MTLSSGLCSNDKQRMEKEIEGGGGGGGDMRLSRLLLIYNHPIKRLHHHES